MLNPLHAVVSAKNSVTVVKECMEFTKEKFEAIFETETTNDNVFCILRGFSRRETLSALTESVLEITDLAFMEASPSVRTSVSQKALDGAKKAGNKFLKDKDLLNDLQDDGILYPMTNRR